ncbi:MAG: tRNA (guanine(10)-N(2))-dimethyltransferase [Candidatus Anstonellales archaeon]
MAEIVEEGSAVLKIDKGVFFNPKMEICRDLCSLAISGIKREVDICDAFCGSGIRGVRYKIENENVGKVIFADRSKKAVLCARKNARINKIKDASFFAGDVRILLISREHAFNFIEYDPFGSPAPFIYDACRYLEECKKGWMSITATDTAVLCGSEYKACVRNYGSFPLHNEMCHEIGIRILIGMVQRSAAQFNLFAYPLFSLSDQHYFKIIIEVEKDASRAYEAVKRQGFVLYNQKTLGYRIEEKSFGCKKERDEVVAGPLYVGKLHSDNLLEIMRAKNKERKYQLEKRIEKILGLMGSENGMPPLYYDLHRLAKKYGFSPLKTEIVVEKLRSAGFLASRTHFRPTAIKTDAETKDLLSMLR